MVAQSYAQEAWLSRPVGHADRALAGKGIAVRTAVSPAALSERQADSQLVRQPNHAIAPGHAPSSAAHQTSTGRTLLVVGEPRKVSYLARAIAIWPRIDRALLRRCSHDPRLMAAKIARRTSQPLETIVAMLTRED